MSQENIQDKDFEAYSKLDYEAKLNELYVYGRNDRRTLRDIAKNVSTILEIVEALAGEQFKDEGFGTPSVPQVQQPKQVQQKPKPKKPEPIPKALDIEGQPTIDDLSIILKDFVEDLEVSNAPDIIKPKKFMGDKWGAVKDTLKPYGYVWVSDGKNSRWEYGAEKPKYEPDHSDVVESEYSVDVSEIEWNTKVNGETVSARPGEDAWAHVMGWDRDKKKSTGQPKQSTRELHDALQQADYYCDGEYVYRMNGEASFFSREVYRQ